MFYDIPNINTHKTTKMIQDLKDIDRTTEEGRLLFVALVTITTESQKDKTPSEVIEQLNRLANLMDEISYEKNIKKNMI